MYYCPGPTAKIDLSFPGQNQRKSGFRKKLKKIELHRCGLWRFLTNFPVKFIKFSIQLSIWTFFFTLGPPILLIFLPRTSVTITAPTPRLTLAELGDPYSPPPCPPSFPESILAVHRKTPGWEEDVREWSSWGPKISNVPLCTKRWTCTKTIYFIFYFAFSLILMFQPINSNYSTSTSHLVDLHHIKWLLREFEFWLEVVNCY